jgi:hypothetical protein
MKLLLPAMLGIAYSVAPVNAQEISIEVPQKVVTVNDKTDLGSLDFNIRFGGNADAESLLGIGISKEFSKGNNNLEFEVNFDGGIYKTKEGLTRIAPKVSFGRGDHAIFLQYNIKKDSDFGVGYTIKF